MLEIRRIGADQWRDWRAVRLAALGESPGAFGSKLEDWQGAGDQAERWRQRLEAVAFNVIGFLDGAAIGQASGSASSEHGSSEVISMWVAPGARGRGVGEAMIDAIAEWSASVGSTRLILDVKADNARAIGFYDRRGFVDDGVSPHDAGERRMVLLLAVR